MSARMPVRGRLVLPLLLAAAAAGGCGKGGGGAAPTQGGASAAGGARAIVFPVEVANGRGAARRVPCCGRRLGRGVRDGAGHGARRGRGRQGRLRGRQHRRTGQKLAEIEPDRYRVQVDSAKATLARAEANLADAQAGLKRREQVNTRTPGLVKEEDLETFRTRVRVAEADVAQARSALDLAQLNQRDAIVRAPTGGRSRPGGSRPGSTFSPAA